MLCVAAQLPKGESAPDLNGLVADALARRLSSEHTERVPGPSQESLASLPNNDSDGLRVRNNENTLGHESLPNRAKAARQE
ncbi:hypothetical protein MY4038_010058 [Beauveria bassiana]